MSCTLSGALNAGGASHAPHICLLYMLAWNMSIGDFTEPLGSLMVVLPGHAMTVSVGVSPTLQHPDAVVDVALVAGLPMWQDPGEEVVLVPEGLKGASVLTLCWKCGSLSRTAHLGAVVEGVMLLSLPWMGG